MSISCPPELLESGHGLLRRVGVSATDEQLFDFLVAVGLKVLAEHPEAMDGLYRLAIGPLFESVRIDCPVQYHPSIRRLRSQVSSRLDCTVAREGAARLAAGVGAQAMGLRFHLLPA